MKTGWSSSSLSSTRAGATGNDSWVVLRASGDRAIVPLLSVDALTADNVSLFVDGTDLAGIDAALDGRGVPAAAVTGAIFVDFDGGGYLAPFVP